jgi:5-methylcytosine-specific restriction endonuclease McrA
MKSYTKVYLKFFDFNMSDFIQCENCGQKSVDLHHIIARSQNLSLLNDIANLMALCRECHIKYGDKKQYIEMLKEKHFAYIKKFKPRYKLK